MTRRPHACLTCAGKTRHANRRCASCRRRRGVVMLVPNIADPMRPTLAELATGIPIGHLVDGLSWRGTDSDSPTVRGRYA